MSQAVDAIRMGTSFKWILSILVILSLVASGLTYFKSDDKPAVNIDLSGVNAKIDALDEKVSNIKMESTDADTIKKLCELTDGCEVYEIVDTTTIKYKTDAVKLVEAYLKGKDNLNPWRRLRTELEDIVNLDRDDFVIIEVDKPIDSKVIAATEEDKKDKNYDVSLFLRVEYKDKDEEDPEVIYLLVKAEIEDGIDVENIVIEKVTRNFKLV